MAAPLSGSVSVGPIVNTAGPGQPFFAPASGGGGGGGGPALNVSTINFNSAGQQNMRNAGIQGGGLAGFNGAVIAFDKDPVPNVTVLMGYDSINDAIQITQTSGGGVQSAALQVDAILCSSINGAAPGGGGGVPTNLEVSTLRVSQGAPNTGILMKYSDGTSSFGIVANDGTVFNQIKPSLVYGNNFGSVVSLGADIVAGGLGLTGTGGSLTSQIAGYISGDGAGNIGISSLNVSSINGAAPGGGGGTVGPNPSFSTLTFPDSIANPTTGVKFISSLSFSGLTSANQNDFYLISPDVFANFGNDGANYLQVNAPSGTGSILAVGSLNTSGGFIESLTSADGPAPFSIVASGVNISSLNVSSINGQAPGSGSVPANLSLSTLTFGGPANPSLLMENTTLLLNTQAQAATLGDAGLSWNNASSNVQLIAPSTTSVFIGTAKLGGSVSVRDDGVYCSPFLSTPNLTVSSINGAAYPPSAGAYPKVSTIGLGGGGVQTFYTGISTNSAVQFTTPFDVEAGHNYQISWNYSLLPSATATYGQYASFTVTGVTVAPVRTINTDLSISTVNQGSIVFTGTGAGGQANLFCVTNTTTDVSMDLGYATTNIELVDLGPIAGSF